jgi:hypothetical protein
MMLILPPPESQTIRKSPGCRFAHGLHDAISAASPAGALAGLSTWSVFV